MSFEAPYGANLVHALGAGSTFDVAVVERGGQRLICKRLIPRMRHEAAAHAAMDREAELLARVRHDSLPTLVDRGTDGHGPFLIESIHDAPSIRRVVTGYEERGRVMAPELFRAIMRAGFQALAELHALGELDLVLGDIGPDHVLAARGQVYFVDFGHARYRGMPCAAPPSERGTLPYVPPEVARGECEPSQASDVYALAGTLAFLALRRDPCRAAANAARLVEIAERGIDVDDLPACSCVDADCRAVLSSALAFDPGARTREAARILALL